MQPPAGQGRSGQAGSWWLDTHSKQKENNIPCISQSLSPAEGGSKEKVDLTLKYLLVLRLAAIALLVPADTSECERIFSLMNNLKTADRSALGQANLKNIMIWHTMAQDLSYEQVPVQEMGF